MLLAVTHRPSGTFLQHRPHPRIVIVDAHEPRLRGACVEPRVRDALCGHYDRSPLDKILVRDHDPADVNVRLEERGVAVLGARALFGVDDHCLERRFHVGEEAEYVDGFRLRIVGIAAMEYVVTVVADDVW